MNIGSASKDEIDSIVKLADDELGKSYLKSSELLSFLNSNQGELLVIRHDSEILGFCTVFRKSIDKIMEQVAISLEDLALNASIDEMGILIKTVVIKEGHQGKGLWSSLYEEVNSIFPNEHQFCLAWNDGIDIPIAKSLKRFGFEELLRIKDYWKRDSIEKNSTCPTCGQPPCRCEAVLYFKTKS